MQVRILESDLLGKTLTKKETGVRFKIEKVYAEGMSRYRYEDAPKHEAVEDLDWFIKLLIVNVASKLAYS